MCVLSGTFSSRFKYFDVLYLEFQDSFVSNLLRLIHTMKPPKKKKKKKDTNAPPLDPPSQPSDPVKEKKKQQFPGLSLPDNPNYVQSLLKKEEDEGERQSVDAKVASEALNEVCRFDTHLKIDNLHDKCSFSLSW